MCSQLYWCVRSESAWHLRLPQRMYLKIAGSEAFMYKFTDRSSCPRVLYSYTSDSGILFLVYRGAFLIHLLFSLFTPVKRLPSLITRICC